MAHRAFAVVAAGLLGVAANDGALVPAWKWNRVLPEGSRPAGRQGHASVSVGGRVYVIGGCVQDIQCLNDVHVFDTQELRWFQEPFTGDAPEARGGHSVALVGTNVFLFGGASSEATFGDVYKLDLVGRRWARAVVAGAQPSRRTNHASVSDIDGRIYVFGGYGADGQIHNDLWIMDVFPPGLGHWKDAATFPLTWEQPDPTGAKPAPRFGHTLTLVDRRLVLFGGYTADGRSQSDVHFYDLDASQWSRPELAGPMPSARQAHSAARHGRTVVVAGGCDVAQQTPTCYNDAWALDMVELKWVEKSADFVTWFAREGHTASFVRGRMVTFGGCQLSAQCYNDITVLDTFDPCAAGCGGHGECVENSFCRCSAGWTGHDCMQPLSCPMGCSNHGVCTQSGTCECENGWAGADCATELTCPGEPRKCSGHGTCLDDSSCHCAAGFFGKACERGEPQCPSDCSGHGFCSALSQCACHDGWSGKACSTFLHQGNPLADASASSHLAAAPGPAALHLLTTGATSIHSMPGVAGTRVLQQSPPLSSAKPALGLVTVKEATWSWFDEARRIFHPFSASSMSGPESHADGVKAVSAAVIHGKSTSESGAFGEVQGDGAAGTPNWGTAHQASAHASPAAEPRREDFGINEVNPNGYTGVPDLGEDNCKDDCNFRGVCVPGGQDSEGKPRGQCYCQPGYWGDSCGYKKASGGSKMRFTVVIVLATASAVVSFILFSILLHVADSQRRTKESKMDYAV